MTKIEKYNAFVEKIEEMTNSENAMQASEIVAELVRSSLLTQSQMEVLISFFTNMSLIDYVKSRKMNCAVKHLMDKPRFDCRDAIYFAGYSEQSNFIRGFRKRFGVTPKEAYDERMDLVTEPAFLKAVVM